MLVSCFFLFLTFLLVSQLWEHLTAEQWVEEQLGLVQMQKSKLLEKKTPGCLFLAFEKYIEEEGEAMGEESKVLHQSLAEQDLLLER